MDIGKSDKKILISKEEEEEGEEERDNQESDSEDEDFGDGDGDEDEEYLNYANCKHEIIDDDGVCCDCSMTVDRNGLLTDVVDYSDCTSSYGNILKPDFEKDLAPLKSIPDIIKKWISDYSTSSKRSICRLEKRKERIFAYIILAYGKNNIPLNRQEIIDELKIDKNGVNEAVKAVAAISQKELPQPPDQASTMPLIVERPVDYLDKKLKILNNETVFKERERIRELIMDLAAESNFIREEGAEDMCIAIIEFYMNLKNYDTKKLRTKFPQSKPKKIADSYKIVEEVYSDMMLKYQNSKLY